MVASRARSCSATRSGSSSRPPSVRRAGPRNWTSPRRWRPRTACPASRDGDEEAEAEALDPDALDDPAAWELPAADPASVAGKSVPAGLWRRIAAAVLDARREPRRGWRGAAGLRAAVAAVRGGGLGPGMGAGPGVLRGRMDAHARRRGSVRRGHSGEARAAAAGRRRRRSRACAMACGRGGGRAWKRWSSPWRRWPCGSRWCGSTGGCAGDAGGAGRVRRGGVLRLLREPGGAAGAGPPVRPAAALSARLAGGTGGGLQRRSGGRRGRRGRFGRPARGGSCRRGPASVGRRDGGGGLRSVRGTAAGGVPIRRRRRRRPSGSGSGWGRRRG